MSGAFLRKFKLFDNNSKDLLLTDQSNVPVAIKDVNGKELALEANGGVPVNIQDQTTRPIAFRMSKRVLTGLTLASSPTVDSYDVTLTTGHGVVATDRLAIVEINGTQHIYTGLVLSVAGDVLTLDTPIPFAFTTSAEVFTYDIDMNIDGSSTTQVFSIKNDLDIAADITRVLFHIVDTTAMDDAKFGGGAALTRGIVFRKKISANQYVNYWNVKNNGRFGELAYDVAYNPKAPSGSYGLTVRLTYGGQSKHGVVIRIEPGEEIELLIQDNLTGLSSFHSTLEGHLVTN